MRVETRRSKREPFAPIRVKDVPLAWSWQKAVGEAWRFVRRSRPRLVNPDYRGRTVRRERYSWTVTFV